MVLVERLLYLIPRAQSVVSRDIVEVHIRRIHRDLEHYLVADHLSGSKSRIITCLCQTVCQEIQMLGMLWSELKQKVILRSHVRLYKTIIHLGILYRLGILVLFHLLRGISLFNFSLLFPTDLLHLFLRRISSKSTQAQNGKRCNQKTSCFHNYIFIHFPH